MSSGKWARLSQFPVGFCRYRAFQGTACVLQTWEGCRVSISSVASTWGGFDEGTPRSSTHRMKLINFMSYLNGFTVRVDSQSVCAAGRRVIGRERPTVCVCEREKTELLSGQNYCFSHDCKVKRGHVLNPFFWKIRVKIDFLPQWCTYVCVYIFPYFSVLFNWVIPDHAWFVVWFRGLGSENAS